MHKCSKMYESPYRECYDANALRCMFDILREELIYSTSTRRYPKDRWCLFGLETLSISWLLKRHQFLSLTYTNLRHGYKPLESTKLLHHHKLITSRYVPDKRTLGGWKYWWHCYALHTVSYAIFLAWHEPLNPFGRVLFALEASTVLTLDFPFADTSPRLQSWESHRRRPNSSTWLKQVSSTMRLMPSTMLKRLESVRSWSDPAQRSSSNFYRQCKSTVRFGLYIYARDTTQNFGILTWWRPRNASRPLPFMVPRYQYTHMQYPVVFRFQIMMIIAKVAANISNTFHRIYWRVWGGWWSSFWQDHRPAYWAVRPLVPSVCLFQLTNVAASIRLASFLQGTTSA